MQWTGRLIAPLTITAAILGGCGDESATTRMQDVYTDVGARDALHYAAVKQSPTIADASTEVTHYDADMHALADRMRESCGCGPNVSMMPDGMGDIHRTMDRMVGMVDRHAARALADTTLAAMRLECDAHHDSMDTMMNELGGMLGMMSVSGGGMHGTMSSAGGAGAKGMHR